MVSHAPPPARVPYLRCMPWAVDSCALSQGECLTLYTLTRTSDAEMLARKVSGAEFTIRSTLASTDSSMVGLSVEVDIHCRRHLSPT